MRRPRTSWCIPALLAAILVAGGCAETDVGGDKPDPAVSVEEVDESQPAKVQLSEPAVVTLGIQTRPVAVAPASAAPARLVIPYSAIVYDADGKPWTYALVAARTFKRVPIAIKTIAANQVLLTNGPKVGTPIVVVGSPELVGAEAGISGEE